MKIVLASESPFRRRALDMLGLAYEICPSEIDEKAIRDSNPAILTEKLAEAKARKVASEYPDAVVISGDAVVSKGGRIYEKPRSMEEAAQFLRELSGSQFQFVTALDRENAVRRGNFGYLVSSVGRARLKRTSTSTPC
jgi:septum formation protein